MFLSLDGGGYFACFQLHSIACHPLCRAEVSWLHPVLQVHLVSSLFSLNFGGHVGKTFWASVVKIYKHLFLYPQINVAFIHHKETFLCSRRKLLWKTTTNGYIYKPLLHLRIGDQCLKIVRHIFNQKKIN